MFKTVKEVRDEVSARCNGAERTLQIVSDVFETLTIFDEVVFAPYKTPPENPVWGRFSRWSRSPGVYAAASTVVEIAYADHLPEDWRRFVVCKELCHALDVANGIAVSPAAMDNIVKAFAIRSAAGDLTPVMPGFAPEVLAEVGAVELLFPIVEREEILANRGKVGDTLVEEMAKKYKIPEEFARLALHPDFIPVAKILMEGG